MTNTNPVSPFRVQLQRAKDKGQQVYNRLREEAVEANPSNVELRDDMAYFYREMSKDVMRMPSDRILDRLSILFQHERIMKDGAIALLRKKVEKFLPPAPPETPPPQD